jgi:hypothetical protein
VIPAMVFIGQLVVYHAWLVHHGISTYDHITYKRELQVKQAQLKVSSLNYATVLIGWLNIERGAGRMEGPQLAWTEIGEEIKSYAKDLQLGVQSKRAAN